ncbi:High molecular weight rubredoxin [bacterium]|nr:MAG: High molecular weight rubredoxin [bacterium]
MNRRVFHLLSYGMYVVSSRKGDRLNGQIANTVFQVASEPPLIAVSINRENLTHEFIRESKVFAVSILSEDSPMELVSLFGFRSGRDEDKFQKVKYTKGKTGCPILSEYALGYLEAEVISEVDAATHTVFIGRVVEGDVLSDGTPMTYAYYHKVKRGRAPERAPTYVEEKGEGKWRCRICGYIYDPEKGDPENGIPPGTSFDKLPENWVCPVCGAGKEEFEEA